MSNIRTAAFGGQHTPKQLLLDALNNAIGADVMVICYKSKNGLVTASWSTGSLIERLGLCELAKTYMQQRADEADECDHQPGA